MRREDVAKGARVFLLLSSMLGHKAALLIYIEPFGHAGVQSPSAH
jgi:hypothetical protein